MKSYLIKSIDKAQTMRIYIADTTAMVSEIQHTHKSSATGSAALGRLATIAGILGLTTKNKKEKLTIRFDGKGVGGRLTAVANSEGNVKVTATNPQADAPSKYPGKLDVSAFVGTDGNLAIIRDYGLKEPYTGFSKIVTGEIAEDIASYFYYSEQTPTVVSLGVLVDIDLSIKAAGGIFIQALPSISEKEIARLEEIIAKLPPVSKLFDEGLSPEQILKKYFSSLNVEIIGKEEIQYICDCSRERIETGLISIGSKELKEIIDEDGEAEVICDFCKIRYHFDEEDLKKLLEECK